MDNINAASKQGKTHTESEYLRKDLRKVVIVNAIIIALIAGLWVYEQQTGQLTALARQMNFLLPK